MRFRQKQVKCAARDLRVGIPNLELRRSVYPAIVVGILGSVFCIEPAFSQTTSPLEILSGAPKVRLDDPEPTPRPVDPVPYVPPRGPAPVIRPVQPALTPYAGTRVGGAPASQPDPYYPPATQAPRFVTPTPTPRPILGPEDVNPKPKKGFVRGLINAIPFVGGDDDEETPVPAPPARSNNQSDHTPDRDNPASGSTIYRGYDAAPPHDPAEEPLLLPPGSTPLPSVYPSDPEPSSPPIMTPTPRAADPSFDDAVRDLDDPIRPDGGTSIGTPGRPDEPLSNAPVLTVKRESDSTSPTYTQPAPPSGKSPALSPPTIDPTPKPLERATTSVLIQESRPSSDSLGPEPDASATSLKSFDPTATPAPDPVADQTAVDDLLTSLVIEQADLGMPNPTYEQNASVLAEFQDAVRKARADDHAGAAQAFRDYGLNHPSSGLAPRAYFLSIVFETSRSKAKENLESLRRLFPESRYLKEAETRRTDIAASPAPDAEAVAAPIEAPREKVVRLEKELTAAVGDAAREPVLRKDLGLTYLELEEYDRAYEVLRPAAEMSAGQPAEGEVLLALGRVMVGRGETVQAISLYDAVDQKYPDLIYKDAPSAWSVGLAFEGGGRYSKARTIYNTLRQRWPESVEAGWATSRLTDLASLQ